MKRVLALVAFALIVHGSSTAAAQGPPKRFWLTDDGFGPTVRTLLLVQEDGVILASYPILNNGLGRGADSSVTVDPADGTLWGVKEANPARLVHYTPGGVIEEIVLFDDGTSTTSNCTFTNGTPVPWPCFAIDPPIQFPEGAAIDYGNGAIWIVEDPPSALAQPARLYKLRRHDFSQQATYNLTELGIISPQDLAVDPFNGSLWVTDNFSPNPQICNLRIDHTTDTLLVSFCIALEDFDRADPDALESTQGITVDEIDGSLWVTSRSTQKVYNLSTSGLLLGTTPGFFDPNGEPRSLTGVAFAPVIDLGAASTFSWLGLDNAPLYLAGSGIFGDAGIGPGGSQRFTDGFIRGQLVVDPTADNSNPHQVQIGGGVVTADLTQAVTDARAMSDVAGDLAPTRFVSLVTGTVGLAAKGRGANVVWVNNILLGYGHTLWLKGGPGDLFVINVRERLWMLAGSIRLVGGLKPNRVLFNLVSTGESLFMAGGSRAAGTFLVPSRKAGLFLGSFIDGALIAGEPSAVLGRSGIGSR